MLIHQLHVQGHIEKRKRGGETEGGRISMKIKSFCKNLFTNAKMHQKWGGAKDRTGRNDL